MQKRILISAALLAVLTCQSALAGPTERRQAKRIHDRLTGVPPSAAVLDAMETALNNDASGKSAAAIAIDPAQNPNAVYFYNVTLKNWATPWTNEEQTVFDTLNDYSATVIGMVRDDVDFRELLYGDIIYTGADSLVGNGSGQISAHSNSNNDHYEELEALGPINGDLSDSNVLEQKTQSSVTGLPAAATGGVVTSRASGKAFFYLGTNRAVIRFTMLNHLCTDLEQIKDNSRPADRVRQDVSRSPGGDSRIFLNNCFGCHAGMDALDQAYAYYDLDFQGDKDTDTVTFNNSANLVYTPGSVVEKHLINANNFPTGYINTDDRWINYWRNGPNALLGWQDYPGVQKDDKGNAYGAGIKTMGMELAYSDAFAQCQVKKAFQNVCFRNPDDYSADRGEVANIVSDFQAGGYQMKQVFQDVAAWCKGD